MDAIAAVLRIDEHIGEEEEERYTVLSPVHAEGVLYACYRLRVVVH
jgi:hypothetical protein